MKKLWILSVSLFLISWWLDSSRPSRNPPLVNYDSLVFFNPVSPMGALPTSSGTFPSLEGADVGPAYFAPGTRDELVALVQAVARTAQGEGPRRRIRVVGAGHSWSAVAKSEDLFLSLFNYKGLVSVDKESLEVTFRGGTTLHEVNTILDDLGLALTQLGSISEQTVAGAIATGTHGSGIKVGNMATFVTRLELVTGQGEVLTLSATDNDTDLFRAAQVNLGLLGVVTEVTFKCEPGFNLEETLSILPLESCLSDMHRLVHSAQHVKMWVEVFSEMCVLYQSNRTEESPRNNPSRVVENIRSVFYEVYMNILSWMPSVVPEAMMLLFKHGDTFSPYNRVDVSHRVFNIPCYIPGHHESEMVVGIEHCAPGIKELKAFVEKEEIPLNYITEVRFVQGDNISLSPNFQRDSCHITLCINNPEDGDRVRYFRGIFTRFTERGFKPRVHWGKHFDLSGTRIKDVSPDVQNFLDIRRRLDPGKIFTNNLLAQTLEIV